MISIIPCQLAILYMHALLKLIIKLAKPTYIYIYTSLITDSFTMLLGLS